MKFGMICPSEIAYRRFLPALSQIEGVEFVGLAINSPEERLGSSLPNQSVVDDIMALERSKADNIISDFGGKIFNSYKEIVCCDDIDALYIPLPPALHYEWAKKALLSGKHVLVEKPATISLENTIDLINIASEKGLALHENYMFAFHNQLNEIDKIIESGELGDVRLYSVYFGFPKRAQNDFRYNENLGGGSLIDAGGYTLKYACHLLGDTARVLYSKLNYTNEYKVDMYGSGALSNDKGRVVQIAFGMDNEYRCSLDVWGSKGSLSTGRVLTAPAGFIPVAQIVKGGEVEEIELPSDDTFKKSIEFFISCIKDEDTRNNSYSKIEKQAKLFDEYLKKVNE